jgi:hypothetical protein
LEQSSSERRAAGPPPTRQARAHETPDSRSISPAVPTQVIVEALPGWLGTGPGMALAIVLLVGAVAKIVAEISALRRVQFNPRKSTGGDTLVVLLHGFAGGPRQLRAVAAIAREIYPGAEILYAKYSASPISNKDPYQIASRIEDEIDRRFREHSYRKIVLVGYSMGSLLLRKAYLWAHGPAFSVDRPGGSRPTRSWVERVDRVVLLAGANRGWTLAWSGNAGGAETDGLRLHRRVAFGLGLLFGRLTRTARLVRSFQRGCPFVADLRVQWIRFTRSAWNGGASRERPPVIQILGTVDDIVSVADNKDVMASKDFVFLPVEETGHANILDMDLGTASSRSPIRRQRAEVLRLALRAPIDELRRSQPVDLQSGAENVRVHHAVFVMHGIRDFADWTRNVEDEIRARVDSNECLVIRASYGYFTMGSFLLFGARQRNVRWLMDRYTEALAKYPNAKVSYVGHSNGTYLLASALDRYKSLMVHRVLFAGSVVRRTYDWDDLLTAGRVGSFHNVLATRDWVVGIFPRFFEWLREVVSPLRAWTALDVGAAGFRGFEQLRHNVGFAVGGHSAAIDTGRPERIRAIADYVANGEASALAVFRETGRPAAGVDTLSRLCWAVWVGLLILVAVIGFLFTAALIYVDVPTGWAWVVYSLLVIALLYSI